MGLPLSESGWEVHCDLLRVCGLPFLGQGQALSLRYGLTGGFTILLESMGQAQPLQDEDVRKPTL
jgi:hypothetical protein